MSIEMHSISQASVNLLAIFQFCIREWAACDADNVKDATYWWRQTEQVQQDWIASLQVAAVAVQS